MDISTFDKEVKAALGTLPEEPIKYVKAVVNAAMNYTDSYFVDITWQDKAGEKVTQLKLSRDISSEEIREKIKGAYDCASIEFLM